MGKGDTIAPDPTGVAGPTRGEPHKVLFSGLFCPGTSPAWQPHSKRLSGCRATKQLRYPNSWGSISTSPTRIGGEQGKPSTWEAHLTVHPRENAQPGKERPTHVVTASHIKIPGFRRHPKEPQVRALFRPRPFPHSENGRAGQSSVLGMPRYHSISKNRLP